jgi:hypothetical protein
VNQRSLRGIAPWVQEEMANAPLEDKRWNERRCKLLSDLGDRPAASIPAACGGHKEMTAAYRFFDNPKVTYSKVLEPHLAATRRRMAEQAVVLLVQDTTEANRTRPHQQVEGAGPRDGGTRRGAWVHPLEAFSPDGTPRGAVSLDIWTREDQSPSRSARQKEQRRRSLPIEPKESFRWLQGLRTARQVAQELPQTQIVCVADREADSYELFAEPRGERPVDWLIRAYLDRCVQGEPHAVGPKIRAELMTGPVLFTQPITVRSQEPKTTCEDHQRRRARKRRTTQVCVRAAPVTLRPPHRPGGVCLPAVTGNVVLVSEPDPPAGEPPVEWLLVTTLPTQTLEQVRQIVHY